jgi:hypothetical protein
LEQDRLRLPQRQAASRQPEAEVPALLTRPTLKKRLALVCLLCAAQICFASGALAREAGLNQADPSVAALTLNAYETELQREVELIPRIKSEPTEIARMRASLPSVWLVQTKDAKIRVPTEWLDATLAELQAHPKRANELAQNLELRLTAMREAAMALEGPAVTPKSGVTAKQRLDSIFRRKEFEGLRGPSDLERWEARIGRWIAQKILWLLQHLHIRAGSGNFLAWGVIGMAFLALCYWVYRGLSRASRRTSMPHVDATASEKARAWIKDALAAADRGDYREAVHCAYWAAVARLEDLNLLTSDRSRTPRESLRLLNAHPTHQDLLRELTRHFELIWYGYRPASATDWSSARLQLEKMGCLRPSMPATANS